MAHLPKSETFIGHSCSGSLSSSLLTNLFCIRVYSPNLDLILGPTICLKSTLWLAVMLSESWEWESPDRVNHFLQPRNPRAGLTSKSLGHISVPTRALSPLLISKNTSEFTISRSSLMTRRTPLISELGSSYHRLASKSSVLSYFWILDLFFRSCPCFSASLHSNTGGLPVL